MKVYSGIKKFFFPLLIVTAGLSIKYLHTAIRTSNKYVLSFDGLLSLQTEQDIAAYIAQHLKQELPEELYRKLKAEFPVVRRVRIQRNVPQHLRIQIDGDRPRCRVNDDKVFTCGQLFLSKKFFNQDHLNLLKKITVYSNDSVLTDDHELRHFITALDPELLDAYDVDWRNKMEIVMRLCAQDRSMCLIRHNKIPTLDELTRSAQLVREHYEGKSVADLRFNKQIVIHKGNGTWLKSLQTGLSYQ